jgi:hypothetical protein
MNALVLCVAACVATPSTTTTKATSTPTTATTTLPTTTGPPVVGVCQPEVGPITVEVCAESTVVPAGQSTTWDPYVLVGTGDVTEVGGVLAPVAGSLPIGGFDTCGAEHAQQVRIVDRTGGTSTFGWDAQWTADDGVPVSVGDVVDFLVVSHVFGWVPDRALVLSDGDGPRFLHQSGLDTLTDAERGGLFVRSDPDDACISDSDELGHLDHTLEVVGWGADEVSLRSGQTAVVALPARDLSVTVEAWEAGCSDHCWEHNWTAWEVR